MTTRVRVLYAPRILGFALIAALIATIVGCGDTTPIDPTPADAQPSFGSKVVPNMTYPANTPISDVILPAADGGDADLTYSLTPLPPGLSFIAASRLLSGTPTSIGNYAMTYRVSDADGDDASLTFTIMVTAPSVVADHGPPILAPPYLVQGSDEPIVVTFALSPIQEVSRVLLTRTDDHGNLTADIAEMFDDGDLQHYDEIKGDGVFTIAGRFGAAPSGDIHLRVVVSYPDSNTPDTYSALAVLRVVESVDEMKVVEVIATQARAVDIFNGQGNDGDLSVRLLGLAQDIAAEDTVATAEASHDAVHITYDSGLKGTILFVTTDQSAMRRGPGAASSGVSVAERDTEAPKFPLRMQTRGISLGANTGIAPLSAGSGSDVIGNNKVLICAPFESVFPSDVEPSLRNILDKSELEFHIDHWSDQDCTVERLKRMTEYGTIVFDTHGDGGKEIALSEPAAGASIRYPGLLETNALSIWTMVEYKRVGNSVLKGDVLAITHIFVESIAQGSFANSVVFNGYCQGTKTDDLSQAFLKKGAGAYLAFGQNVWGSHVVRTSDQFFSQLVVPPGKTAKEAYDLVQPKVDPNPNKDGTHARLELVGNASLRYTTDIVNGDFELGSSERPIGWNTDGDGRVIAQLGHVRPTGGQLMGIVSTGLGFTTNAGSISQSVKVPSAGNTLAFRWNFLSEEFPEYVGSQFQDSFRVTVGEKGKSAETIFVETIDSLEEGYVLAVVSPTIVFDQGGVSMTDWQDAAVSLSKYSGKTVVLRFEARDVGDSIYDSAVLLDDIRFVDS